MKWLLSAVVSITLITLVGCGNPTTIENTQEYKLPVGLEDCSIFIMRKSNLDQMTVMRCPNSNTTTSKLEGKVKRSVVVVDGVGIRD